jgi:hypothetical protein
MSIGPPTASITAVTETQMVAAYETRDAFRVNATASDTPTVTATKPQDRDHATGAEQVVARLGATDPAEHHPPGGGEHAGHEHGGADPDDETLPGVDGGRECDHQDGDGPPVPVGNDGQPDDLLLPLADLGECAGGLLRRLAPRLGRRIALTRLAIASYGLRRVSG